VLGWISTIKVLFTSNTPSKDALNQFQYILAKVDVPVDVRNHVQSLLVFWCRHGSWERRDDQASYYTCGSEWSDQTLISSHRLSQKEVGWHFYYSSCESAILRCDNMPQHLVTPQLSHTWAQGNHLPGWRASIGCAPRVEQNYFNKLSIVIPQHIDTMGLFKTLICNFCEGYSSENLIPFLNCPLQYF